ncbi:VPS35 endosomal protein-sorting factor-like [Erpetoichthys calabaricus]|uniref:VPS35 endosomal protein-sorting factor-like n=1 Tax=Erpetoichthys calabaricus TaxID=27687 RepID=UPI0022344973|nr:VPS35 endosomal protein-sorting factor-like [Erpetoichthys calabaricus]
MIVKMASVHWHSQTRQYQLEKESLRLEAVPVEFGDYHPLKPITVTDSKTRRTGRKGSTSSSSSSSSSAPDPLSSILDGSDPLSVFAAAVTDPLSARISAGESGNRKQDKDDETVVGTDFEPWSGKRSEILARFTTTEKLSINLFIGSDKGKAPSPSSAVSEKVRTRLEELDDLEEGSQKEMLNLSQQDYVNRIEELNQNLKEAWASDQKVKALKIVIQCSKLLSDTTVIQFYPSKFVLITDILDTFGRLVYDRIWSMCSDTQLLPDSFSSDDVNDTARETCLNWFFKIASIRELIPRLYVEAAILKCNRFLSKMGIQETLPRLTAMIRGIGDPLVAVYARAYLCRVGMEVAPHIKESLNKNFFDLLTTFKQIHGDSVQNQLVMQSVEIPVYLTLYSPAIDWIMQCLAYRAPEALLTEMMERCRKLGNNALLLNSIMSAFRSEFIAARAMDFIMMIKESDEAGFPKHLLFISLGRSLACADPPENDRLTVLNEAWKVITKLRSQQDYINCAETWVEYTCRHFTKREVNTVLADIIKHMTPDRAFEDAYPQLQSVIRKILMYFHDFSVLFSMERFLPFLDMFQRDSIRVNVCQAIMEVFIRHQQEPTRDPVILNALMHVCKTMHDSVNALTLDDEKRSIAGLINGFIRMVSFGRDFEQQLSFCVEARATFCNLETVLSQLIHSVNQLAMATHRVVKGSHSRKTAAFVRACAAYCFITIPSLTGIFNRLVLYLHSGQIALTNNCLSQADAFFKAAISLLPDVPRLVLVEGKLRPSEGFLIEFLQNFLSTLLVVPDHPEQGVLFLVRGLLNIVQDYNWEDTNDAKLRIYISALPLLAAMSQDNFLYRINKVESNETLYGGDPKFVAEINKLCDTLIDQILDHLKNLGKDEAFQRQSSIAIMLLNTILTHGDLRNNRLNQMVVNLWNLAQKYGYADTRAMVKILEFIKLQGQKTDMRHFSELALRLPLQSRT